MPSEAQDALVDHLIERTAVTDSIPMFYDDLLELTEDEMEQYLASRGYTSVVLRNLPDEQLGEIVRLLQGGKGNSLL